MKLKILASVAAPMFVLAALLFGASWSSAPATADEPVLPIVFVHGAAGSGAQYESQAMRFASNGYPADHIRAFEYDSSNFLNIILPELTIRPALDAFLDNLMDELDADQVYVAGHSLGTTVMNGYLNSSAERAARVAKYIGIDGASAASCPGGVPCLGIWDVSAGNLGGNNIQFADQTHVQVATSAESFAAQYEFFTGGPPQTTLILPQPPGQVEIAGRSVLFPANSGADGSTVHIWEVNPATGARKYSEPHATFEIGPDGAWGPIQINGQKHYEFQIIRDDLDVEGHIYAQPFIRSNYMVRLLNSPAGSAVLENTNSGDGHAAAVVIRNKEWFGNHPSGNNDILSVVTTSATLGTEEALDILPGTGNGNIGIHIHDDAATPGVSTGNLLPFFPTQPFQTGVDVYMPATEPPDGTISFINAPRGDASRLQVLNVPNWASSGHRLGILFNDYVQDINTWSDCKLLGPASLC